HAGHDPHVQHHIDAVGQLYANLGGGAAQGAHDVGHHVHRAALHTALEQVAELRVGVIRGHPVVGGPGVLAVGGANEGEVLHTRHVVGVGAVQVATGPLLRVERDEDARVHGLLGEAAPLVFAPVAPDDAVGLGHLRHL